MMRASQYDRTFIVLSCSLALATSPKDDGEKGGRSTAHLPATLWLQGLSLRFKALMWLQFTLYASRPWA
jgi:hypothetical protein